MENLSISHNSIHDLYPWLKNLINLQRFDFSLENFHSIPDFFNEIYSLIYLNQEFVYRRFPKTLIEYVQLYCNDPDSLTQEEKRFLISKSGAVERTLLESNLPITDPILIKISERMTPVLNSGLNIQL